jgi:hypothetical protein
LEELGGAAGQLSSEILGMMQSLREPRLPIEPDGGVLMPVEQKDDRTPSPYGFFKVVLKQPSRLQGQPRDQRTTLFTNEIVVVKQQFLFVDRGRGERRTDIQLLTTGDGLIARLQKWEADKETYYWNESLKPQEHLRRQAISMVKTLMDADAIESKGAPLNVSDSDKESTVVLKELERLGVVVNSGSGGNVSSWWITARSANTLVPSSRIHSPTFAINALSETSEHSLISLGRQLEQNGWRHEVWEDRHDQPPPVDVVRLKPKVFYSKSWSDSVVLSKWYLKALLLIGKITCSKVIEHFQTDDYYRSLLSDGKKGDSQTCKKGDSQT